MTLVEPITDLIANNLEIAGPLAALSHLLTVGVETNRETINP